MNPTDAERPLKQAAVILVRPQSPENIGAAARVVANMGLGGLVLVRPQRWNPGRMCALATRLGRDLILDQMELYADLKPALAGFNLVVGTTARAGKFRRPQGYPRAILGRAAPYLETNRLALVFGPEKDGLTNEELKLCHSHLVIPAAREASSLNLAQAVMVAAYELRLAVLEMDREGRGQRPTLADTAQREGMYDHLGQALEAIDPDAHYHKRIWMAGLRRMFGRLDLMDHEVSLIRGICRKICWAAGRPEAKTESDAERSAPGEENEPRALNAR